VPDLDAAAERYRALLGADVSPPQLLPEHGVRIVSVDTGNSKIELMEPFGQASPLMGFLAKIPAGALHHICFEVANLAVAAKQLVEGGARLLGDGQPRLGAHGKPVLFIHPKDFDGTLIELEEL